MAAKKAKKETKGLKVKVDNAIHDGKGGFFKKGDALPDDCDADSLKAKGLAE